MTTLVEDGVFVVAVEGELDGATCPELAEALAGAPTGVPFVIDLCECSFMDSNGFAVIWAAVKAGRLPVLACLPSGPAARLLKLVRVETVLPHHPDRASALGALRAA